MIWQEEQCQYQDANHRSLHYQTWTVVIHFQLSVWERPISSAFSSWQGVAHTLDTISYGSHSPISSFMSLSSVDRPPPPNSFQSPPTPQRLWWSFRLLVHWGIQINLIWWDYTQRYVGVYVCVERKKQRMCRDGPYRSSCITIISSFRRNKLLFVF